MMSLAAGREDRVPNRRRDAITFGSAIAVYFLFVVFDVYLSEFLSSGWKWVSFCVTAIVLPISLLAWIRRRTGLNLSAFLWQRSALKGATMLEWIGTIALCTFLWILVLFLFRHLGGLAIRLMPGLQGAYLKSSMLPAGGALRLPAILLFTAAYAIVEEVFYRGLMKSFADAISGSNSKILYVVLSSSVFAVVHWGWGAGPAFANFGVAVLAAFLFLKLRDIRPLVAAHFLNNVIALL